MKLHELLKKTCIASSHKNKIRLLSPNGYDYSEDFLKDRDSFLNREIIEIVLRGEYIKIYLQYPRRENNE